MWRFIGVLSLLLLPIQVAGIWDTDLPKECKPNTVCLLFSQVGCDVNKVPVRNGAADVGAVWPTTCDNSHFDDIWAFVEMEVEGLEKYKFVITTYWAIKMIRFKFDNAELTFTDYEAKLDWSYMKNGDPKNGSQSFPLQPLEKQTLGGLRQNIPRYAFVVEMKERLVRVFQSRFITYYVDEKAKTIKLVDDRYNPQLSALSKCLESELYCFGEDCNEGGKLTFGNGTANCSATLRYWNPAESPAGLTRSWTKFDHLECELGNWKAVFGEEAGKGDILLDATYEVSCSSQEPGSMTDYFKILLGATGGVVLLIFIVTIITVGFCARRLRRNRRNQLTLASMSAGSIAMTPTTRRASLKASETNRETNRDAVNI